MPCSLVEANQHSGESYCLHLQGRRVCQARNQHESGSKQSSCAYWLLNADFLLGLLFDPADGGDMFPFHPEDESNVSLWKVGWLSPDYTVLYPRRQYSLLYFLYLIHSCRAFWHIHIEKLQKCACQLYHVCLSTVTTWELLRRFPYSLIMGRFTKVSQHIPVFYKIRQQLRTL
jgi:hypothetical protein